MMAPRRESWPSSPSGSAAWRNRLRPLLSRLKATVGFAMASRLTTSDTAIVSDRSPFMNFSRAGVAWNRSRTSMRVPVSPRPVNAAGRGPSIRPASTNTSAASSPAARDVMVIRLTEPMEGSASPRKPIVWMFRRSTRPSAPGASFDVACRSSASSRSSDDMPQPSSSIVIRFRPPSSMAMLIRVAPASSAFSTNSFTAAAGRSTTSPAAMRLTTSWGSLRICGWGRTESGMRKP